MLTRERDLIKHVGNFDNEIFKKLVGSFTLPSPRVDCLLPTLSDTHAPLELVFLS